MTQSQIRIAKLDHDGIYWGLEVKAAAALAAGDLVFCARAVLEGEEPLELPIGAVWVGEDCDLAPGAYRWNADDRRFVPLPKGQRKAAPEAPSLEQALADYLRAQPADSLPPRTSAWLAFMKTTIDERK